MFGSQVLETAIGLVFVFLSVSLITTAIQELIASATKLRALTLRSGLKSMLVNGKQGQILYDRIITHPTVAPTGPFPSYVSAQQFSGAVLDVLGGAELLPSAVSSVRIAAQNMPDSPLKPVLNSLFREGETDMDKFEARLQQWFDQSMDRVSGTYKRISQALSLAIGVVLAFMFQINAIGIVGLLWSEAPLRRATDNAVSAYLSTPNGGAQPLQSIGDSLSLFGLRPVWDAHPSIGATWIIGCAITAVAVSFGAPFWFDMLQRFVNVRGTGPTPQANK